MKKVCFCICFVFSVIFSFNLRAENITVAVIAPKQGDYKKDGIELFNGAKLAIDEVNNNGGLKGKKIDILTIDDRCDDRLAVSTAEMLSLISSKKIALVIGPYCSNRFEEIAKIYEKSKIFQIVPTTVAYSGGSVDKKGQIMFLGTKSQMSGDFFNFYNQNFAGLKTAFIYDDNKEDGYADVAKSLFEEFRRHGKSELLKFFALNDDTNVGDLIENLKRDGVGIVFVLSKKGMATNFIIQLKNVDENMILFTAKDMLTPYGFETLSNKANGIYFLGLKSFKDSLMFTESLVEMRLSGIEPKGFEVYSYGAVKLWSDLVENVDGFDYDELAKVSNSDELKEKWSEFMMHSGSIQSSRYVIELFVDGVFKQVY